MVRPLVFRFHSAVHPLGFITDLEGLKVYLSSPLFLILAAFQIWMLVDAIRRGEYLWAVFILLFSAFSALLYYFLVYRAAAGPTRGFELPGAYDRRRIRQLQAQIHHLDKAYHHTELGNIFFQQDKLDQAAASFRAALERDPDDLEPSAHLGQCLLRQGKAAEALPLLEKVCARDPHHEYGYSLMALAETYTALDNDQAAITTWQRVLDQHAYARARVQLAELQLKHGQREEAAGQLRETIADDAHAPGFQRRRDRVWIRRARRLLRRVGA